MEDFLELELQCKVAAWSQRVFVFDAHLIRKTSFMELFFFHKQVANKGHQRESHMEGLSG